MIAHAIIVSLAVMSSGPAADGAVSSENTASVRQCVLHTVGPAGKGLLLPIVRCSARQAVPGRPLREASTVPSRGAAPTRTS